MSDSGEVEVGTLYPVLPKEVTAEIGSVKLFNKWSYEDVEIRDISLTYVPSLCLGFVRCLLLA
jgi:small subunit ribosomal protein S5e